VGPHRWLLPASDENAVRTLGAALAIGRPAAAVLVRRGLSDPDSARRFLKPSLDDLHPPWLLRDMAPAVERLRRAILNREKVLIYGDYDVDGTTAVVLLTKAIELAGGAARYHIPHRLKEGYGMRPEVVEAAAEAGVHLIISVDTGIRAAEVVRRANELAIDVIVTDHHLPEADLPPALAVINPNRPECAYPEKELCGAAIAFKLAQALLEAMQFPAEKVRRISESLLKMAAIATVADVVPLRGENRVIVKHGLAGLRDVRNPGLKALLEVAGFNAGRLPSSTDVAFRIAPRLNAAGRMDTAKTVIDLFLTADPNRARELARQLHDQNAERQQVEAEIVECCEALPVDEAAAGLVYYRDDWHRGVLGIVASRLVERLHRPVFVLGRNGEDGLAQGSGRSISAFNLLGALEAMPDLFVRFGGHRHAAGVTLEAGRVEEFRERFDRYARTQLSPEDLSPELAVDAAVEFRELNERTVGEVLAMAPFGHGNPAPVFAALGVEVAGPPAVLNEKHLTVTARQGGRTLFLKAWNFAARAAEFQPGARVDLAFKLEEDAFNAARGNGSWRAVLKDVRATAQAAAV
jgi:single-stranded-DNA-specific exonuclease